MSQIVLKYQTVTTNQRLDALYVIDPRIGDQDTLIAGLPEDAAWVVLDDDRDGLEQLRDLLAGYSGLSSLHLIGHGTPGSLLLGLGQINLATINQQSAVLAQIGQSLNANGDILLYGCNVGQGDTGHQLIEHLGRLTQADIAASTDQTGALGNWVLEAQSGSIETPALNIAHYSDTLSLPSITPLNTSNRKPTLTGTASLTAGRTLEIELGGKTYKAGDGKLSIDSNTSTWSLNLGGESNDLALGSYNIQARIVDAKPAAAVPVTGSGTVTASSTNAVNLLSGSNSNDSLNGQTRADIAVFSGNRSDYTITAGTSGITVKDNRTGGGVTNEGTDTLSNLNQLKFADGQEFVLAASQRVALTGSEQLTLNSTVVNGINVTASKLYNGTKAAETFVVSKNVSAMILAGAGDTVDLSGRISDYTYTPKGSQLQISDGTYTTTVNLGGAVTLRTASGSTTATLSFSSGQPVVKLGNVTVDGSAKDYSAAITPSSTVSSNAMSIVSDGTTAELVIAESNVVYGDVVPSTVTSIARAKQAFYTGIDTLTLASRQMNYVSKIASPQASAETLIDTANGALIGLSSYGPGRIAVIGSKDLIGEGLSADPTNGGMARGIFNMLSWLANDSRAVGEENTLHVLSSAGKGASAAIHTNQSLFWEHLNDATVYTDATTPITGDEVQAADFAGSPAAARYSEALLPDGHWSRNYDVVVLRSDAAASEVQLVRQWLAATGGGLLIADDRSYTASAAVKTLMAEVGLTTRAGSSLAAGNYAPTEVDPMTESLVRSELSGLSATAGTVGHEIYVNHALSLPTEIMGGTAAWSSSDTTVMGNDGVLEGVGAVTLTATVTFANGATQTHAFKYSAFAVGASTDLSLRIIDASSITKGPDGVVGNSDDVAATSIDSYLSSTMLAQQVPLYSGSVSNIAWANGDGYPGTTAGKDALWVYSGFIVPPASGAYQIKITADDSAKFYITGPNVAVSQSAAWWSAGTQTITMQAGEPYKLWVFFKPSTSGGNRVALSWALPGSSTFETIPASALAAPPGGLLSGSAGYPTDWLPFDSTSPTSSGSLSSTVIMDQASLTSLYGNEAPVVTAQTFDFSEKNLYFDAQNLVLTDGVAARTKSLSIKLHAGAGSAKNIELVNYKLDGVSDGATLAEMVETALNSANGNDVSSAIDVSYDAINHTLRIVDTEGRTVSNFVLAKASDLTPRVLSGALVQVQAGDESSGTASIAKVKFEGDALAATRLAISLDSMTDAKDVVLEDLAHVALGLAGMSTYAKCLQDSIQARGETHVTVTWDDTNKELVFTDSLGRTFTNIELYTTSKYEPLLAYGDDASTLNGVTTAVLGTLGGQVQASDANGDALTYTVLEGTKFGSVSVDAQGQWSYDPGSAFKGWDQFTVSVSDGHGGSSAPISISISDQGAPQVAMPVVRTFTVEDPTYVEPTETGKAVPSDFIFKDVFIAQTHVQRPDDPYLQLVGSRYALIKVNATSASEAAAPDIVATVTDKNGKLLGSLRLTGPAQLPTSVDLPSSSNLGTHSHINSYEAPLPSEWIQPGITISVTAGSGSSVQNLSTFSPKVGADATLTVRDLGLSMFEANQGAYITGLGSWGQEAVSKLPVQSLKLYEYPLIKMDSYGKEQAGNWGVWTGNTSNLPGTDPVFGGGFQSDISFAIHLAGSLKAANFIGSGSGSTMAYVGFSPNAGGGLGGGAIGGGDATAGILWHEFAGHGEGRGHAADDANYPYNDDVIEGLNRPGWLGPNWGYDQITGAFLPNYTVNTNGTITLQTDPMAGGSGQQPKGYVFQQFSDYYNLGNYLFIAGQTQWVSDPSQSAVDGGFAGDGYFKSWDATNKQWVVWNKDNYATLAGSGRAPEADLPHQADQKVYWLSMNIVDQNGAPATPGVTYADDLKVLPVRTIGDLSEPFRDILTGEGRALDSNTQGGDYVMRITYATENGLITDHLIIPANYGRQYAGFNVADKGELVRVDIVEAENASVSAYLENKIVSSYVNSKALANTVFKGDSQFNAEDASLVLPHYWNGGKITWSTTVQGLIDLQTGHIDSSKLQAGSAIRAEWVQEGRLHTQTFMLKLPDTVQTMHQLFGDAVNEANPSAPQIALSDLSLPIALEGAAVSWLSSNPDVISHAGQVLGNGSATLTATVSWSNGAVQTFSETFNAVKLSASDMGGMQLRVYSTTGLGLPSFDDDDNDSLNIKTMDAFLVPEVLNRTPLFTGAGALPDIAVKNDGNSTPTFKLGGVLQKPTLAPTANPAQVVSNGQVADSLWVYSGYYVAPTNGTYTFALSADQVGRLYMEQSGQTRQLDSWSHNINDRTLTVTLTQGEVVPMWVYFKTQSPVGAYWGDWVSLKVKLPGESVYSTMPTASLAPMTDSAVLPFKPAGSDSFNLNDTQVDDGELFTPLSAQPTTQLTQTWLIEADSPTVSVVSGQTFEHTVTIPPQLALNGMQHWVKLLLRDEDGALVARDSLESWQVSTSSGANATALSVKGTIDSTPGLDLLGLQIYTDDQLTDKVPAALINVPLNNATVNVVYGSGVANTLSSTSACDYLVGNAGQDTFMLSQGKSGALSGSGFTGFDTIADLHKGALGTGDVIHYAEAALSIGGAAAVATASQASINQTTGVASFATGSGTTLADALGDVAARFAASADVVGELAFFRVNGTGDNYLFISDGAAGVTANDVVVKLQGQTAIGSIDLTNGHLTVLG